MFEFQQNYYLVVVTDVIESFVWFQELTLGFSLFLFSLSENGDLKIVICVKTSLVGAVVQKMRESERTQINSILAERPTDLCLAECCLYLYQGKEPKTGAWLEPGIQTTSAVTSPWTWCSGVSSLNKPIGCQNCGRGLKRGSAGGT